MHHVNYYDWFEFCSFFSSVFLDNEDNRGERSRRVADTAKILGKTSLSAICIRSRAAPGLSKAGRTSNAMDGIPLSLTGESRP